jgi:DNA polymerase IV
MNWMFLDMNSYFASVEQHFRPELRGRPVAVVPVKSEHTSVIASSGEAKRYGVKTGTPVWEARQKCPGIALVQARPRLYVQTHHAILRSVDVCVPIHKVYSIDEWAIRLLGREQTPEVAADLARKIKTQFLRDFSPYLTCSIGIAPTRLLGKIASDLQKPDGLVLLDPAELPDRIAHLALRDLCGIGQGMEERLQNHGVHTVRDLWNLTRREAVAIWHSIAGGHWWAGFHGVDEPEIPTRRGSMSHANVLHPKFRNEEGAYGILVRLTCRLGVRLRNDGYFAEVLRVHVQDVRGHYWYDEAPLSCSHDTSTLLAQLQAMWRRRPPRQPPPLKVGVDVAGFTPVSQVSEPLFDAMQKPRRVSQAVDAINRRWGAAAVYVASMHNFRHPMDDKIAFGRIPSEV